MQPQAPSPNLPSMQTPPPNYDFIVNPGTAPKKQVSLPSFKGTSAIGKVLMVLIILFILMIVFVVIKSVTAKPSVSAYFVSVAQDQAVLLDIANNAQQQQGTKTITKNSAVTVTATITSAQNSLNTYMGGAHIKVSDKVRALKIKASTDTALTDAAATGSYDAAYKTAIDAALAIYLQDLKTAYTHTTGPKGRAELTAEYNSAQLLAKQLD